jgi:hypothetical protein
LLRCSPRIGAADGELAGLITAEVIEEAVGGVPDEWLEPEPGLAEPDLVRQAHARQLTRRLAEREAWLGPMLEAARNPGPRRAPVRSRPDWLARSPRRASGAP